MKLSRRLPPYSVTIGVSAVLVACGIFGWGESLRSQAGDAIRWGGRHGTTCSVPGFPSESGAAAVSFMQTIRRRVDAGLPIYVARGEPLNDPLMRLRGDLTLSPQAPRGDGPIDPAVIAVEAVPQDLGCLLLIIATVYGASDPLDAAGPLYELRPSPGVRVQVYAPGLEPGPPSKHMRAWLESHLVPYGTA